MKSTPINEGNGDYEVVMFICGFPNLKRIVVDSNSLKKEISLTVSNNPKLTTFIVGDESFEDTNSLSLSRSLIDD